MLDRVPLNRNYSIVKSLSTPVDNFTRNQANKLLKKSLFFHSTVQVIVADKERRRLFL